MKPNKQQGDFLQLLKQPLKAEVPLGFQLLRLMGTQGEVQVFLTAKSKIHQSDHYGVGAYYKPIAYLDLEEKEETNE